MKRIRFNALGTVCEIQFLCNEDRVAQAFASAAVDWVNAFEAKYTRFRSDSLIGRINAAAGKRWVDIDEDAEEMFALVDQIVLLTNGALDPTALPLLKLWNYKAKHPRIPDESEIRTALAKVGWRRVRREPGRIFLPEEGMGLDLGGFGKEYAVDRVAQLALSMGVENFLIDFGHDVRVHGNPGNAPVWSIGVEDPRKPGALRGQLLLNSGGVASSGDYIRYFIKDGKRYGHIVDPRTGYPVANECLGVTVVCGTCLEAGLLSTSAFLMGPESGMPLLEGFSGAEGSMVTSTHEFQTRGYYRYAI